MRIFSFIFIFCIHILFLKAQGPPKGFVEDMKSRALVVILLQENEEYVKNLIKAKDTLQAAQYKNRIAEYNKNMQELVPKFFSFYKNVQYKNMDEVFSMSIGERRQTNFLAYNTSGTLSDRNSWSMIKATMSPMEFQERYHMGISDSRAAEITWKIIQYEFHAHIDAAFYKNYYKSFLLENDKNNYAQLELYAYDQSKNQSIIAYFRCLPNLNITKGELAFFFKETQCLFSEIVNDKKRDKAYYKENAQLLKDRTLIILKDNLAGNLTEEEIKKAYPHDFKIVNKDEYEKTILEGSEKNCYIIILPLAKIPISSTGLAAINWFHEIIDASTGKIISTMFPTVVLIPGADGSNKIHMKHFKKYLYYDK